LGLAPGGGNLGCPSGSSGEGEDCPGQATWLQRSPG
jgi:hypothetical protein